MIYELLELLQRVELVLFVSVVELFQVLFDLLAVVQKAHFQEVEEKKQVKFLALLEGALVLAENQHQSRDLPEGKVAAVL